jgi:SAM-dependent methyltransferase
MSSNVKRASATQVISFPRFAAFYNWLMDRPLVRRWFDPLRREIIGQAHGVVLEVGAGGGQNFPFYDPTRVERVEAVEPDEAMLVEARRRLATAPVPITPTHAQVESLPFPDAHFDSAVATLVFCSVGDPEGGLREIWRVLKPGGRSCSSNMCARKGEWLRGSRMRWCPSRPAAWAIAIGTAIPCAPASRPRRSARSERGSSPCCSCRRPAPTYGRRHRKWCSPFQKHDGRVQEQGVFRPCVPIGRGLFVFRPHR